MRIVQLQGSIQGTVLDQDTHRCGHLFSILVKQDEVDLSIALHLGRNIQHTILVVIDQVWSHTNILQVQLGITSIEIVLTNRTAQTPEVLVLAPRAIAPTESLEGYQVLAFLQIRCNVKLGCNLAILGISHELAVHVEIDVGSDATEVSYHLLAIPTGRNINDAAIRAHMVILGRNCRWLLVEVPTPRKTHVDIFRLSIAQHFPVARHLYILPLGVIEIFLEEVGRTLVGILYPVEFPCAIEREIRLTFGHVHVQDVSAVQVPICLIDPIFHRIAKEVGVQRKTIDGIHLKVVPLGVGRLQDRRLIQRLNGSLRFLSTESYHRKSCHT